MCVYYLFLQPAKLSLAYKGFENTTFNDISGIGIPGLLMNIISCHGFVNVNKSTVILSCHRKLVDYYLSGVFVILEKYSSAFSYVPLRVKQIINA